MISKTIFSLCLLAAAISQNVQYKGDMKAFKEPRLVRTSLPRYPTPIPGSTPGVYLVQPGVVYNVLLLAPDGNMPIINKNSQYNNEWASIVRLLQLLRESPVGLPSSPSVLSPPSGPPTQSTLLENENPALFNKTFELNIPSATINKNSQYNNEWALIVRLLQLLRESPVDLLSSPSVLSPPSGPSTQATLLKHENQGSFNKTFEFEATINKNSQYNNEWASIVRLLQLLRESPVGLPSSPSVSSPPSGPSTQATLLENENPALFNKTFEFEGVACSTNDVTGVCMELRKCHYASQEIQNRKTLRFCGYFGSEPVVCCILSTTTSTANTTTTSASTTPEPALTTAKSNDIVSENDVDSELVTTQPERQGCGWSYPRFGVNNGTSGGEVQYGEFPWTCAILMSESVTDGNGRVTTRDEFVHAGVLIHPAVVLVRDYMDTGKRYRVRAGVGSGASTARGQREQLRDVQTVDTTDELYLTVLFLTAPMTLAPNIAVACLPPPIQQVPPGTRCIATLWDHKRNEVYNNEARLLKVPMSEMERYSCEREMVRLGYAEGAFRLADRYNCMTLSGTERAINETLCKEMLRQNSPLSCPIGSNGDRYMLTGFVWYSYNCANDLLLYIPLSSQPRTWIDAAVTAKGYYTTAA